MSSFSASIDRDANFQVIQGRDAFRVSNSVAFAATTTGSVAAHTLFTVTGDVAIGGLAYVVNTSLTSGGAATLSLGSVTRSLLWLNVFAYTALTAGVVGTDNGLSTTSLQPFSGTFGYFIGNSDNITYTVGTAALTGGKITFYVLYRPLSVGASIVAVSPVV